MRWPLLFSQSLPVAAVVSPERDHEVRGPSSTGWVLLDPWSDRTVTLSVEKDPIADRWLGFKTFSEFISSKAQVTYWHDPTETDGHTELKYPQTNQHTLATGVFTKRQQSSIFK